MSGRTQLGAQGFGRSVILRGTDSHAIKFASSAATLRRKCRKTLGLEIEHQSLGIGAAGEATELHRPSGARNRRRRRMRSNRWRLDRFLRRRCRCRPRRRDGCSRRGPIRRDRRYRCGRRRRDDRRRHRRCHCHGRTSGRRRRCGRRRCSGRRCCSRRIARRRTQIHGVRTQWRLIGTRRCRCDNFAFGSGQKLRDDEHQEHHQDDCARESVFSLNVHDGDPSGEFQALAAPDSRV